MHLWKSSIAQSLKKVFSSTVLLNLDILLILIVPMAVGSGVLTTCNYKAREFGVRSGMAGYIAKRWYSINHTVYTSNSNNYRALPTTGVSSS